MKLIYLLLTSPLILTHYLDAKTSLVPPNAKTGECYAKVVIPATYKTVQKKILVQESSDKISIIPAKYEWINKEIEITPESKTLISTPAHYKKITENIEVKAPRRVWHTSLKRGSPPVSKELLVAAKIKGVDIINTIPGTCYREYYAPEQYKTVAEEIIVEEQKSKKEVIPAKYETIEKVIEIKPASKKVITTPAKYEFIEEKILIEKEKNIWKKGVNPAQKLNGATGEIMCLIKVPAKYKVIKKRVVKSPSISKVIETPAETKTIKIKKLIAEASIKETSTPAVKKVIQKKILEHPSTFSWMKSEKKHDKAWHYTGHQICLVETPAQHRKIIKTIEETPPSVKEIIIKPTYKIVKIKKLVEEATEIKTPVEAIYKTIDKKERVSDSYQSWKRILCQTNMNKEVILKIQQALEAKKYQPGKADGVLGQATRVAIDKYQRDNSLATGGITYETLNALKIEL